MLLEQRTIRIVREQRPQRAVALRFYCRTTRPTCLRGCGCRLIFPRLLVLQAHQQVART
jgi:hypothetical protein